ncbi:MAG: hypothetical protein NXH95_11340 [Pseudomonadaceae bacterium]|nr:hypothetical protein [Pseudomonadaceae bacterium]
MNKSVANDSLRSLRGVGNFAKTVHIEAPESNNEPRMFAPMKLAHIRMLALAIMSIGIFLFVSMIVIAFQSPALLTGIVFKMFVFGLLSGSLITLVGAILFRCPSLGQLGTDKSLAS